MKPETVHVFSHQQRVEIDFEKPTDVIPVVQFSVFDNDGRLEKKEVPVHFEQVLNSGKCSKIVVDTQNKNGFITLIY